MTAEREPSLVDRLRSHWIVTVIGLAGSLITIGLFVDELVNGGEATTTVQTTTTPVTSPPSSATEEPDEPIESTTPAAPVAIKLRNWFGMPIGEVTSDLEALGFTVISYRVCSGSVGSGEVRQILDTDGRILVDKQGVTSIGERTDEPTTVEVKVGTGAPCD